MAATPRLLLVHGSVVRGALGLVGASAPSPSVRPRRAGPAGASPSAPADVAAARFRGRGALARARSSSPGRTSTRPLLRRRHLPRHLDRAVAYAELVRARSLTVTATPKRTGDRGRSSVRRRRDAALWEHGPRSRAPSSRSSSGRGGSQVPASALAGAAAGRADADGRAAAVGGGSAGSTTLAGGAVPEARQVLGRGARRGPSTPCATCWSTGSAQNAPSSRASGHRRPQLARRGRSTSVLE